MRILIVDPSKTLQHKESESNDSLSFFFSPDWEDDGSYDLIALPVGLLLSMRAPPPYDVPIIAFGPADLLPDAFAGGASDYMKDPWDLDEMEARALRYWKIRFRLGEKSYSYSMGCLEVAGTVLRLPDPQRKTLRPLLHRLGKAVPRDAFFHSLDFRKNSRNTRILDMNVSRLRKSLSKVSGDIEAGTFLVAVRNYGYLLDGKPCG